MRTSAIADYRQAQAEGIEDRLGLASNLAWRLYRAGHAAKALPILEEWLAANPEPTDDPQHLAGAVHYPFALDTMAQILAAVGRSEAAAERFLEAAEIGGPERPSRYRPMAHRAGLHARGR